MTKFFATLIIGQSETLTSHYLSVDIRRVCTNGCKQKIGVTERIYIEKTRFRMGIKLILNRLV